LRKFSPS